MSKLINSISPFEKAKLGILLPIVVQLLLKRHYCAISRHFYCISIYNNSISNYKNGLRKNPSPFICTREMPINTGDSKGKMKGEGFLHDSFFKKNFDSLFEQDIQSVTDLRVNMES